MVTMATRRPGVEGGARDTNRRRRLAELRDAGLALFLAHGIEPVSIEEIALKAGMAKGSFYRYFRDKADLVEAILDDVARGVGDAFTRAGDALGKARDRDQLTSAYRVLAEELAAAILQDPMAARLYLQECRAPRHGAARPIRRLADRIAREAFELTRIAREQRLLRPVDPHVSSLAVIGAVERLLWGVLADDVVLDPLQAPVELISMVLDGLRPADPAIM